MLADPDRIFALGHVPKPQRAGVSALWALDEQLGQIVASTSQPIVGQMRLLWWRDALNAGTRGHPVLEGMTSLAAAGVDAEAVGQIIDGWEELLEPLPLGTHQLTRFAELRGTRLFALSAQLIGEACPDAAGAGWALNDFGLRCSDPATAIRALDMAVAQLETVEINTMPRPLRILARLALKDAVARQRIVRTPWKLLRSVA